MICIKLEIKKLIKVNYIKAVVLVPKSFMHLYHLNEKAPQNKSTVLRM